MSEHAQYEEWCVLAAAGQISAEEFAEFQTHLRESSTVRRSARRRRISTPFG